ncbi:Trichohyalin [Lasiodiplodia theobromae]|uniref:Trichohyalin n=1 Tax=Lasiodiplodia theobromae TaxID=45133 RepID=A0A5N5DME7_9PEZI|nr:Trichohyalin [Lasiodiplodia theobromae]
MCIIEQRTYIQPDGKKETYDHVKSRCELAGTGKSCRKITYEERTMQGAGHSRHSPRIRYADESSSPATESLPPTPVNGATFVEVTPTTGGFGSHPSPKHRKTGSLGQIVFNLGGSRKEKEKQKGKPKTTTKHYYGSSAVSEATSASSTRSYSPAPPSPTHEQNLSPTYQYSHRRSHSATMPSKPSMAYATTARAARRPDSRGREEVHLLSPQTHADLQLVTPLTQADPPRGPPGPPRPPAPPAHADPPSPDEPSRRRSRRPPPIVTQPSTSSSYRPTAAASRPPNNRPQDPNQGAAQSANDREFAEKLSASLNNLRVNTGNSQHEETDDERQARIERERATGREQLRRERQADEFWAQYHRDRQERREEGRKMNEQSRPADDWEARLEEGRRRVEQEHRNRQQETRHDPSVDAAAPADSSGDEDWEAQLEEGRRRLAELRRTEETATSNAHAANRERRPSQSSVNDPLRRRNTTGGSHGQRHRSPRVPLDSSSTSRSNSSANATASSSIGADTTADREAIERNRLLSFEREQMARERQGADVMLASQIADAQADIQRAEARIAARRDREQRERMVEGNYGAFAYDGVNSYAPQPNDFYNPRLGMGMGTLRHENRRLPPMTHQGGPPLGEPGWERGQRVIHEARGGGRRSRRSSVSYHQYPAYRWDDQR